LTCKLFTSARMFFNVVWHKKPESKRKFRKKWFLSPHPGGSKFEMFTKNGFRSLITVSKNSSWKTYHSYSLVSRKPYTYNLVYRPVYYVLYTELYTVLYTVLNTALCTVLCTLIYTKLYPDIKVASELKCFLRNTSPPAIFYL